MRIITGLAGGMIPPNSMAAVADVLPAARRAQAFGLLMAFASLSSVVGIPVVAVLASAGGWRVPFFVLGSLLFVCAVFHWFWYPKIQLASKGNFSFISRYKQMAAMSLFRSALAANFLQRAAFYGTLSYLAAFLISKHGMSVGETAVPLAIVGVGVVVGSSLAGPVTGLRKRARVVAICAVTGGLASLVLFSTDMPICGTVAVALVGITVVSVGWPAFLAISTEISGSSQATAVGMLGASNQLGGVAGASLGGVVLALGGFSAVGFFCLGATVVSAVVLQFTMGDRKPQD
ncbi:MAG: MFS transporter [Chloroflexi bacterium]|nr:MFS transporter [Chloroflexota bacterium]